MTMTPTATGYDLTAKLPPRHRATMTAKRALLNFETKAGLRPQPKRGAHYAPITDSAVCLAEEAAFVRVDWDVTR